MKIVTPLALACTVLVCACTNTPRTNSSPEHEGAAAPVAASAAATATQPAPATATEPAPAMAPASEPAAAAAPSAAHSYRCESGATIVATYPSTDSATVQYQGNTYTMQIAVSASGSRYVGGGLEWWTKGAEGTVFRHNADGTSGDSVEVCSES